MRKKNNDELLPIYFDFKKRLLGMLRLRNEIVLTDIEKFLQFPKKDILSLLKIIMEEGEIQGEIRDDIFYIHSDMDLMLDQLDEAFKKWKTSSKKKI